MKIELPQFSEKQREKFNRAAPFRHIVIDNFLEENVAQEIEAVFFDYNSQKLARI